MAFVDKGTWMLNVGFEDNNGNYASCGISLPGALPLIEAEASAAALIAAMGVLSTARIVSYSITRGYENDNTSAPAADSEVERKLVIPLGTNAHRSVSKLEVPSPAFGLELAGTDVVDETDAGIIAIRTLLTQGLPTPGNGFVAYYGADITRTGTPFITHRSRKPNK